MKKNMGKKILVICVIVLFISINSASSSDNTEKDTHPNYRPMNSNDFSKELFFPGNIAYVYCAYGLTEGIYWFELDDPGTLNFIAETESGYFLAGGTWSCDGKWYACEYNSGGLWVINPETGEMENIGGGGTSCNDLSWDPIHNILYGVSSTHLIKYDPVTGEQETVGGFGVGTSIIGIAIDSVGVAYIWDVLFSGSSTLYTVDLKTCEVTEVGSLGINLIYSSGGHFDYDTDILYLTYSSGGGILIECDEDTGDITVIGDFENNAEITSLVIPFQCYQYTTHDPIYINGNENFTTKNGVTGGSGTSSDPYGIENWVIRASSQDGIQIRNTTAFFEINDCYIHQGLTLYDGIVFYNVTNGVIENNVITKNRNGIMFRTQDSGKENSEYNIIKNNSITNNSNDGIHFEHTGYGYHNNNTIAHNNIVNNTKGIYLIMSEYNLIVSNNIISNIEMGIMMDMCEGGGESNKIHHNNFVNNIDKQAYELGDPINIWDDGYPSGGNYWSDYTGEDDNGDGIGDTPYDIPGGISEDRYPLMDPWGGLNLPPNKPSINGPIIGKPGIEYDYSFVTLDPDDDDVKYVIDWFTTGEYVETAWYESGEKIILPHTWPKGTFKISAKAIDSYGAESEWGNLTVTMPKDRLVNNMLFWRIIERFPLLQKILYIIT